MRRWVIGDAPKALNSQASGRVLNFFFRISHFIFARRFPKSIWAMLATVLTTITPTEEIPSSKDHQAKLVIVIVRILLVCVAIFIDG